MLHLLFVFYSSSPAGWSVSAAKFCLQTQCGWRMPSWKDWRSATLRWEEGFIAVREDDWRLMLLRLFFAFLMKMNLKFFVLAEIHTKMGAIINVVNIPWKPSLHSFFVQSISLCPLSMNVWVFTRGFSAHVCRPGEEHLQQDLWRFSDEESLRVGLGQRLLLRVSHAPGELGRASHSGRIWLWCPCICHPLCAAEGVGRVWWLWMISCSRNLWRSAPSCCFHHRSDWDQVPLVLSLWTTDLLNAEVVQHVAAKQIFFRRWWRSETTNRGSILVQLFRYCF